MLAQWHVQKFLRGCKNLSSSKNQGKPALYNKMGGGGGGIT